MAHRSENGRSPPPDVRSGLSARDAIALGLKALDTRREFDAIQVVEAAATRHRGDAPLHHVLGLLHRALGNLAPAIAALDHALTMTPASARLVHARARAAQEAGLPCLDWYAQARRLAPDDGDVILGQASALLGERDEVSADRLLTDMLTAHPGWLPGHLALIRLRYQVGRDAEAMAQIDAAIGVAPRDPRLHELKINVLQRGGRWEDVSRAIGDAAIVLGDTQGLRAATAMLAAESGAIEVADAAFARVDPVETPELLVHWLRHLIRRGEPERVVALAKALPPDTADLAIPYLSIAYRTMRDDRAAWLDNPALVKVIDLDDRILGDLADTLRRLHVTRSRPLDQSVYGGTQTDGPLFSRIDPVIQAVRKQVEAEIARYIRQLPSPDPAHPTLGRIPVHPRFAGSWSVRLAGGGYHSAHIHTEGWLSSAFYVRLPERSVANDDGWLALGKPPATLNAKLAAQRMIEPKPGRLVLFPSLTWHGTQPFEHGERLTLAFDVA